MNQVEVQRVFVAATIELMREEMPDVPIAVVIELLTAVVNTLREIAAERGNGEVLQ